MHSSAVVSLTGGEHGYFLRQHTCTFCACASACTCVVSTQTLAYLHTLSSIRRSCHTPPGGSGSTARATRRPARSLVPAIEEVAGHVLGVFRVFCVFPVKAAAIHCAVPPPLGIEQQRAVGGRERAWQDPAAAAATVIDRAMPSAQGGGHACQTAGHYHRGLGMQNTIRKRDALAGARGYTGLPVLVGSVSRLLRESRSRGLAWAPLPQPSPTSFISLPRRRAKKQHAR